MDKIDKIKERHSLLYADDDYTTGDSNEPVEEVVWFDHKEKELNVLLVLIDHDCCSEEINPLHNLPEPYHFYTVRNDQFNASAGNILKNQDYILPTLAEIPGLIKYASTDPKKLYAARELLSFYDLGSPDHCCLNNIKESIWIERYAEANATPKATSLRQYPTWEGSVEIAYALKKGIIDSPETLYEIFKKANSDMLTEAYEKQVSFEQPVNYAGTGKVLYDYERLRDALFAFYDEMGAYIDFDQVERYGCLQRIKQLDFPFKDSEETLCEPPIHDLINSDEWFFGLVGCYAHSGVVVNLGAPAQQCRFDSGYIGVFAYNYRAAYNNLTEYYVTGLQPLSPEQEITAEHKERIKELVEHWFDENNAILCGETYKAQHFTYPVDHNNIPAVSDIDEHLKAAPGIILQLAKGRRLHKDDQTVIKEYVGYLKDQTLLETVDISCTYITDSPADVLFWSDLLPDRLCMELALEHNYFSAVVREKIEETYNKL